MGALNDAGTIGIFGIFAILLVREVLLFAGKHPMQNGHPVTAEPCSVVTSMQKQIEDLHETHMATDEDGVAVLPRLAQQSRRQTELLVEIRDGLEEARQPPAA